ncbi:small multi-drug export protein [bacterium]|nr:small multi-drug export protein [bacterium]
MERKSGFLKTKEGLIFFVGCILFVGIIILFSFFQLIGIKLLEKILPMIALDILAGRGASICMGLGAGMSHTLVAFISILINTIWLFIFYPLFVYYHQKVIKIKIIGNFFKSIRKMAERNQAKVERYGILGLGIFVWVPFTMTGSLVGAIIGYLIGMRTRVILMVVFFSMVLSAFSWSFGFDYIFRFARKVGTIAPGAVVVIIIGMILFFHWRKIRAKKNRHIKSLSPKKNKKR